MPTRIPKPPTALTRHPDVTPNIFGPLIERVSRIVSKYLEHKEPERKTA